MGKTKTKTNIHAKLNMTEQSCLLLFNLKD